MISLKQKKTIMKKKLSHYFVVLSIAATLFLSLSSILHAVVVVKVSGCTFTLDGYGKFECVASEDDCYTYQDDNKTIICTGEMRYLGN